MINKAKRGFFRKFSWLFCVYVTLSACIARPANSQTATVTGTVPVYPKYMVLGVVYAPPGSSSSVTYGSSQLVGSSDSISTGNSTTTTQTTTKSSGFHILGFGSSKTSSTTSSFEASTTNTNSMSVNTTSGNSIATMGPISAGLGVDHDNDVIYILLNAGVTAQVTYNPSTGATIGSSLWNGFFTNGCDFNSSSFTPSFAQQLYGCDPNQYPYPDIIGIPVWCLKNPYYPGQGCAQWLQYTERSWDQSYRGLAYGGQNLAYPSNPLNSAGLTLQDYADILQADPFVQLNGNWKNVCHPAYGPNLDPNSSEVVITPLNNNAVIYIAVTSGGIYSGTPLVAFTGGGGSGATGVANLVNGSVVSVTITNGGSGYTSAPIVSFTGGGQATAASAQAYIQSGPSACGASNTSDTGGTQTPLGTVYNRFQPYGTVQYPLPGPNGLPSTYSGSFQYQSVSSNTFTSNDSHASGSSSGTSVGFSLSVDASYGFGKAISGGSANGSAGIDIAGFDDSFGMSNGQTTTFQNSNSLSSTSQTTSTATYSITGPQLSDNYSGPATYGVYLDNVYGTYAFYSSLEPAVSLGTIDVTSLIACPSPSLPQPSGCITPTAVTSTSSQPFGITIPIQAFPPTPVGGTNPPTVAPVTLINHSSYPMTMVYPAVTFNDPGFQIVEGLAEYPDGCSNQYLYPYGKNSVTGPQTYYCTLYIKFQPLITDAPNPTTLANTPSVQATMIAAGTENASSYQNILVTSQVPVSGVVTGSQGATLLPAGVSAGSLPSGNPLPYVYVYPTYSGVSQIQSFTFTNNYSVPVSVTNIGVSNNNFSTSGSSQCTGLFAAGQTCSFTVSYQPSVKSSTSSFTGTGTADTGVISVMGSVPATCTGVCISPQVFALASAGTAASGAGAVTIDPSINIVYYEEENYCQTGAGTCDYGSPDATLAITNSTGYQANVTITPNTNGVTGSIGGGSFVISSSSDGNGCRTVIANSTCTITITAIPNGVSNNGGLDTIARYGILDYIQFRADLTGSPATFSAQVSAYADITYADTPQPPPPVQVTPAPGGADQTVNPGGTAQYSLQVSPTGSSYPGVVYFTATGLPTGATVSFSPVTLAANAGAQAVIMSVQTAAVKGALKPLSMFDRRGRLILCGLLLLLPLTGVRRHDRTRSGLASFLTAILLVAVGVTATSGITGCAGREGNTVQTVTLPAPQTYTIVITATSGGRSQSAHVSLTVE